MLRSRVRGQSVVPENNKQRTWVFTSYCLPKRAKLPYFDCISEKATMFTRRAYQYRKYCIPIAIRIWSIKLCSLCISKRANLFDLNLPENLTDPVGEYFRYGDTKKFLLRNPFWLALFSPLFWNLISVRNVVFGNDIDSHGLQAYWFH